MVSKMKFKTCAKRLLCGLLVIWCLSVTMKYYVHLSVPKFIKNHVNMITNQQQTTKQMRTNIEMVQQMQTNTVRSDHQRNLPVVNSTDTNVLRKATKTINKAQLIRNSKFSVDLSDSSTVILVQVHKRLSELNVLIESLKLVKGIENTLVIFSHDVYQSDINKAVHDIDFCPVMQIFYPYSIQIYMGQFPSDSSNDCPRNISKDKAKKLGCTNAEHPDRFNHYREGKFTQMKHHWLWKLNFVFNEIRILKQFNGIILRLDNDYYLAPDILHVIKYMKQTLMSNPSQMFILGNHEQFSTENYKNDVQYKNWYTGIGRGMGITRQLWQQITKCSRTFCTFDDYNWDWSLQKVAMTCMHTIEVLKIVGSRVFHVGHCSGFHAHVSCKADDVVVQIKQYLQKNKQLMFPKSMSKENSMTVYHNSRNDDGYGGWADPRDHKFCLALFNSTEHSDNFIKRINGL